MLLKGRVWKFGENIDTDQMMPQFTFKLPLEEQARAVFGEVRPGWAAQVSKGDILVAGRGFGIGSSRPAARLFKHLGIDAVIAESINGLFFRNSINYGLLAMNAPGIADHFQEGEIAEIDPAAGRITNLSTGASLRSTALPELLIRIVESGGILSLLQKEGDLRIP